MDTALHLNVHAGKFCIPDTRLGRQRTSKISCPSAWKGATCCCSLAENACCGWACSRGTANAHAGLCGLLDAAGHCWTCKVEGAAALMCALTWRKIGTFVGLESWSVQTDQGCPVFKDMGISCTAHNSKCSTISIPHAGAHLAQMKLAGTNETCPQHAKLCHVARATRHWAFWDTFLGTSDAAHPTCTCSAWIGGLHERWPGGMLGNGRDSGMAHALARALAPCLLSDGQECGRGGIVKGASCTDLQSRGGEGGEASGWYKWKNAERNGGTYKIQGSSRSSCHECMPERTHAHAPWFTPQ